MWAVVRGTTIQATPIRVRRSSESRRATGGLGIRDKTLKVWDVDNGRELHVLAGSL